jgi:hypothetical protein
MMPHKAPSQLQTQVTAPCNIGAQAAATPFMQLPCQVVTCITIPIHRMPASPPNPVSGWRVPVAHQYQALGDLATLNVTSMQPVDWLARMRSLTHSTDWPMATTPSRKHLPQYMPIETYLIHPPSGHTHADVVASQCVTATLPPKASGLMSLSPCVGGTAQKWVLGAAGEGSVRLASLPDWG